MYNIFMVTNGKTNTCIIYVPKNECVKPSVRNTPVAKDADVCMYLFANDDRVEQQNVTLTYRRPLYRRYFCCAGNCRGRLGKVENYFYVRQHEEDAHTRGRGVGSVRVRG